jgi:hypothetical protein
MSSSRRGQAGWHITEALITPKNISIVPLPAKCPELNPVENIWQFMRDNWLSNHIFDSYEDILDHCCDAWIRPCCATNRMRIRIAASKDVHGSFRFCGPWFRWITDDL